MREIAVVGLGGYGQEILDLCEKHPQHLGRRFVVFDDLLEETTSLNRPNIEVLFGGKIQLLLERAETDFLIAIGDSKARETLQTRLTNFGHRAVSLISHETSVSSQAIVGPGASILYGTLISSRASIGLGASIGFGTCVAHDASLGDWVTLGPMTNICGRVTIGSRSTLGAGTTVIPDVNIGEEVTVGAGAVIIHDLPSGSKVVGNPGRFL